MPKLIKASSQIFKYYTRAKLEAGEKISSLLSKYRKHRRLVKAKCEIALRASRNIYQLKCIKLSADKYHYKRGGEGMYGVKEHKWRQQALGSAALASHKIIISIFRRRRRTAKCRASDIASKSSCSLRQPMACFKYIKKNSCSAAWHLVNGRAELA